jgi:hypothetical protein
MHLLTFLLPAAVLAATAASAEPIKIRNSWVAPVTNWASILTEKKDLARHWGKSYVMEPVRYPGTPPMVTAMANNELEISNLAYSTLGIAIQNAGLDDIRIIADEFQDGVDGYYSQEYMVLKDGPIQKVQDLKGKAVMTNAAGSAIDVAMRAMLRKNGLEDKRDYNMIESPFPTMRAMLTEKKVDMIPAVLPFAYDPELRKIARTLFTQRDAIGVTDHDRLGGTQAVPRQESRRHGRLHGGHAAHHALVPRPRQPQGGHGDRGPRHQAAAGAFRLAVHQARHLPRPGHEAEPRCAAAQRRHDQGPGLHPRELRRAQVHRPQHRRGGREAAEVIIFALPILRWPRLPRAATAMHSLSPLGRELGRGP